MIQSDPIHYSNDGNNGSNCNDGTDTFLSFHVNIE